MNSHISLQWVMEFLGTFAFAISGFRLAAAKRFDWYGAFVVGLVVAIGGGTLRDLLLGVTPFWMTDSIYLIVTGVAFIYVVLFSRYVVPLQNTFFIFDTIGLALYTVVGVEKSLALDKPLWVAIMMGMITATAGGVIRDILINEIPLIFRKELYATLCVAGGLLFGLCIWLGTSTVVAEVLSFSLIFVMRILSVRFHIALPKVKSDPRDRVMDDFEQS